MPKNKKERQEEAAAAVHEKLDGQMYGRVVKLLGGCNAMVFCNDNRERLCHIRGSMRKKVWIATGDIVLVSIRDMSTNGRTTDSDRGDICAKYDSRTINKLRQKDPTINEKLFVNMDKAVTIEHNNKTIIPDNDGFVFESDKDDDDDSTDVDESVMPANRTAQKRALMAAENDDDFNIDDI